MAARTTGRCSTSLPTSWMTAARTIPKGMSKHSPAERTVSCKPAATARRGQTMTKAMTRRRSEAARPTHAPDRVASTRSGAGSTKCYSTKASRPSSATVNRCHLKDAEPLCWYQPNFGTPRHPSLPAKKIFRVRKNRTTKPVTSDHRHNGLEPVQDSREPSSQEQGRRRSIRRWRNASLRLHGGECGWEDAVFLTTSDDNISGR